MRESDRNIPFAEGGEAAPEHDGQEYHEECMCSQVRGDSEVAIKGWGAQLGLHPGQIGGLPSYEREGSLPQLVTPFRESVLVYLSSY